MKNPYLDTMEEDILYHFSLSTKTHDLPQMFGDIKVRTIAEMKRQEVSELRLMLPPLFSLCVWVEVPTG